MQFKAYFCGMQMPLPLNMPHYPFKLIRDGERLLIYDELRKKNLILSPEEWVRQHWIQYLVLEKNFPKSLIQAEGGLMLNSLSKRTDLVAFNRLGNRILIAEFKAPHIKISQNTFDQIARYNIVHKVPYLLVSNGLQHYYCFVDFKTTQYQFLADLPDFEEMMKVS